MDTDPEEDLQQQPRQALVSIQGHIQFSNVTFRYHPDSDINTLENLDFTIIPGQTVALVGRSGSGKTTISKLVLGLYPVTDGQILIDGQDITSLSLRSLRSHIGVVDKIRFYLEEPFARILLLVCHQQHWQKLSPQQNLQVLPSSSRNFQWVMRPKSGKEVACFLVDKGNGLRSLVHC